MTAQECIEVLDRLQAEFGPRLVAARTVTEREHWEGFLSALTMAAMTIETKMKGERK